MKVSARAFLLLQNIRGMETHPDETLTVHNPATRELISAGLLQEVNPADNTTRNGLQTTTYRVRIVR